MAAPHYCFTERIRMKKILSIVLLLACIFTLFACKSKKDDTADGVLGEIVENPAEEGVFWEYADESVLDDLNGEFDTKKALTDEFYDVPPSQGTIYYVSSVNGKDTANGKSASTPWKSLSKLSNVGLKAGDTVLLECGSEFRETVKLTSGVTYASYGTGEKPVVNGAINASKKSDWSAVSGIDNLYVYDATLPKSNDIGAIIFNGGESWGIKIQKLSDAQKSLELYDVSNGDKYFKKISSFRLYDGKDIGRYGKYDLSFYHDTTKLYVYCEGGNPAERFDSIELAQNNMLFSGSNISNVTIANISFKNSGRFAIRTQVCKNLEVYNCSFSFIGGSEQSDDQDFGRNYETRLGNAIENWNGCDGMTVENCYFKHIYDTAMTTQSNTDGTDMINISYRNNVIENVVYAIELWSSGAEGANCDFKNVFVEGNVCRNLGYGMTSQRPDKVTGFLSAKGSYYVYDNAVMQNNIIIGSVDWLLRSNNIKTNENPNGYVMDNNIYVNALGNDMGMLSGSFPKYSSSIVEYKYDSETIMKLYEAGVETNGKFYYTADEDHQDLLKSEIINSYAKNQPSYTYKLDGENDLPFRLLFPRGYDPDKQYKLFVYMNYEYASGTDNFKNIQMNNDLLADAYAEGEYIVLVPQCSEGTWTGLKVDNGNYSTSSTDENGVMRSVYELIRKISNEYNTGNIYAAGVSSGGYAVADLIVRHKDLVTAAVIISGAGDVSASVGSTNVWIIHGEGDEKIPVDDARALADAWGAMYTEVNRELHDCWKIAFAKEDIIGWINEQ